MFGIGHALPIAIEITRRENMNTLKFKSALFLIPITALMLQSCGSKTATGSTDSNTTSSSQSVSANSSSNAQAEITPPTTCSHTQNAYASPHTWVLDGKGTSNGTDTAIQYTPNIPYGIDQTLKVQITPRTNPYATMMISKSGANITLIRDGVAVAGSTRILPGGTEQQTIQYPYPNSGSQAFTVKKGLNIDQKSAIVDYSNYLLPGSHTYKIKVNNVQSDINCQVYCPTYNYDYTMWQSCVQANCSIGYEPVVNWSVEVSVETDATPCLTP